MNKLLTKAAKLLLGLSLAAGVGVAIGSKAAERADATDETLTIETSDFNTTSYAANNGSHTTGSISWVSNQIMQQSSVMQWQKNTAYIYNTTDLGTIKSVVINSTAGSFTTYYGTSENPDSNTTVGGGFFKVVVGNATGKTTNIVVTYEPGGSSKANVSLSCSDLDLDISDSATQLSITATSGESTVSGLSYTYEVDDESIATVSNDGKVTPVGLGETELTISFAGDSDYNSASTTITVTVSDKTLTTSDLTFAAACGGSGTASDGAVWAITSDADESTFATDGIHYGTNSANVQYIQLVTSDIKGLVKRVVVTTRDAQACATVSVTVGSTPLTCSGSTTATNSSEAYTFTGNVKGTITVRVDRGSAQSKAIYVKSVVVTYKQITLESISLSGTYPTTFDQGDAFSHEGMTVTASYSDSSTENVTNDIGTTWTGYDMQTAGSQTVTVTYKTKTASYGITVTAAVMYSVGGTITNGSLSSTESIRQNTALSITVNADTGYDRPSSLTVTMGGNSLTAGSGYTYNSSTGAFNINSVTGNVVINGTCSKAHGYWSDDPFTASEAYAIANALANNTNNGAYVYVSGTVLADATTNNSGQVSFNLDAGNSNVLQAYNILGASADSSEEGFVGAGHQVVVKGALIKYNNTPEVGYVKNEFTETELISNIAPVRVLASIAISNETTEFETNDSFVEPTVTATYEDGSTRDVTSSAVFTGYNMAVAGEYTVTVSYTEGETTKTATYSITVTTMYTVSFASGEGSGSMDSVKAPAGESYTLPSCTFTAPEGKRFAGWSVGGNIVESVIVNSNISATAIWELIPSANYKKVKTELANYSGDYLIVYEGDDTHNACAFNGSIANVDTAKAGAQVTISNEVINLSEEYEFTLATKTNGYSLKSASGVYIGRTASSNGMNQSPSDDYTNSVSYSGSNVTVTSSGGPTLKYNYASDQLRFRFFASGQQEVAFYMQVDNAESLALDILNLTYGVCSSNGEHSSSDFSTAWTSLKSKYNSLTSEEKQELAAFTSNEDGTMVHEAMARYEVLVRHYGLEAFITGHTVPGAAKILLSNVAGESTNTIAIITIISLVSVTAIGGYFFIKRREEN